MAKKAFESIREGLEDAIAFAKGDRSRGRSRVIEAPDIDVRALRNRLGLSQSEFARAFMVSAATVRNWEQGRRRPEGPARVLLHVIDREPAAVNRVMRFAAKRIERPRAKRRAAGSR